MLRYILRDRATTIATLLAGGCMHTVRSVICTVRSNPTSVLHASGQLLLGITLCLTQQEVDPLVSQGVPTATAASAVAVRPVHGPAHQRTPGTCERLKRNGLWRLVPGGCGGG